MIRPPVASLTVLSLIGLLPAGQVGARQHSISGTWALEARTDMQTPWLDLGSLTLVQDPQGQLSGTYTLYNSTYPVTGDPDTLRFTLNPFLRVTLKGHFYGSAFQGVQVSEFQQDGTWVPYQTLQVQLLRP